MKKLIFLLISIFISSLLFCQISVGPKAGVSFSRNKNKTIGGAKSNNKIVAGYNLGIIVHYRFSEEFVFQPEISFVQKGNQYHNKVNFDSSNNLTEQVFTEKYNFFEIPLLFKYITGNKIKLNAIIGPAFSFNLGGKYKSEIPLIAQTNQGKIIFDQQPENYSGDDLYLDPEHVNRFEFGVYVGLGICTQLGKGKLLLDGRFGLSTYTHFKYDSQSISSFDYSNRTVQIQLSYVFDLN